MYHPFQKLCFFIILFINFSCEAQNFHWAKSIGGFNADLPFAMKTDSKGNIYTIGQCSNYLDFDPGPGQSFMSGTGGDIFILKLNPQGNFIWAKRFGSVGTQRGWDITVDNQDNVFATGYFSGTTDFNPGTGVNLLTCIGVSDMFMLKLDSAGSFQWVKQIGSTNGEHAHEIRISPAGFIYLTGFFTYTCDFDPGPAVYNLTSMSTSDVFISKYDSNGNFIWAKSLEGIGNDDVLGMSLDSLDNVWISGGFTLTTDFDPSSSVYNLTSVGDRDIFVLKLDSSGAFQWAHRFGGLDEDYGHTVLADAVGNSYLSGWFNDTCDFDPGIGVTTLQSTGGNSIFLLKFNPAGDLVWAKQTTGMLNYPTQGFESQFDSVGNIYFGGYFGGVVDFDPGVGVFNLTSAPALSIGNYSANHFILSLDTSGQFRWAEGFGGPTTNSYCAMDVTKKGEVFMCGYYDDSIKMHPDGINYQIKSIGQIDVFITKYGNCPLDSLTSSITACNAYSVQGQVYSLTGSYSQILPGTTGCDTAYVFNLVVNHPNIVLTQVGITLTASAIGAQYQWINCSGNTPVAGANAQVFIPTANGSYAVIVTENGCSDTSICRNVTGVGLSENINQHGINIYPNPTTQNIVLSKDQNFEQANIRIVNLYGEVLLKQSCHQSQQIILNVSTLAAGIYIIEVEENGEVIRGKFTKVD